MNLLENSENFCRICYSNKNTIENPLLTICKCSGSLKFIHKNCFKIWILSKSHQKSKMLIKSLLLDSFICELCKSNYTCIFIFFLKSLVSSQQILQIIFNDLICEAKNIVFLIRIPDEKFQNLQIFFWDFSDIKNTEILIGRKKECQIKLKDLTISRIHAKIISENNFIKIIDNKSKFGTLLYRHNPIVLQENSKIELQIGRTLLKIKTKI